VAHLLQIGRQPDDEPGADDADREQRRRQGDAELVAAEVRKLLELLPPQDIAVISPYDAQVQKLRELLRDVFDLEIDTVDGFQGREKEAVVVSLVRSNPEGELGFVIGRRCRHVPAARAAEVIAGYTICNDVSVRDWQVRTPTMTMGKSFDTHGPLGPWLVTADEIADPHALRLQTWVNGELRGDKIIDAAKLTGADAIHPGYGFLAENPHFAEIVNDGGLSAPIRTPRGRDIFAACGQLKSASLRRRGEHHVRHGPSRARRRARREGAA